MSNATILCNAALMPHEEPLCLQGLMQDGQNNQNDKTGQWQDVLLQQG